MFTLSIITFWKFNFKFLLLIKLQLNLDNKAIKKIIPEKSTWYSTIHVTVAVKPMLSLACSCYNHSLSYLCLSL